MTAEIISVGTELLLGQILNSDAQYLARELSALGFNLYHQTTVGDNMDRLCECIETALKRSDVVLLSGGLGPTEDDMTKEAVARVFGLEMELDEASKSEIQRFFASRNYEMTPNNLRQAMFPKGGIVMPNARGTAPGCIVEQNGKAAIVLPGPPHELIDMFEKQARPYLDKKCDSAIVSRVLRVFGMGESSVEHRVRDLMDGANPTLAPYASVGEVTLRLTAKVGKGGDANALLDPLTNELRARLGDLVYSTNDEKLEALAVRLLKESGKTLALAESCTGGLVAQMITDVPGASDVLLEGVVAYSNAAKARRLGVSEDTLARFGAVSAQTAREMAEGVMNGSGADFGIGITGIAGPGGGTDEKPVGLVYAALAGGGETFVKKLQLGGERRRIRAMSALHALDMLRRRLLGLPLESNN